MKPQNFDLRLIINPLYNLLDLKKGYVIGFFLRIQPPYEDWKQPQKIRKKYLFLDPERLNLGLELDLDQNFGLGIKVGASFLSLD